MSDRPKLLWHSNSPYAPTGYGNQTGLFAPELAKHYDLAISSFYGLEGSRIVWNDIPVYPGLGGEYGNDYLVEHAARHFGGSHRDGLVVTLMDVWVLEPGMLANLNAACWVPVDHEPAPPAVVQFFHQSDAVPVAMSRFGQRQLAEWGLDPLYMPHGIDTSVFRPHEQREVRRQVGVPDDAFLVGMVAANKGRPSRKGFQQALQAFRLFREKHANAYLYLHTCTNPNVAQGENLTTLIQALEIDPDSVLIADQYRVLFDPYPPKTMAKIYSAMDVFLNPAHGEGFGIPVLEAQACGVPGIVTNFSAMPEVCGAGWHVACRPSWTGQNSWQAIPDVEDIVRSLDHCYSLPPAAREGLSARAREHSLKYDVKVVLEEHMLPALTAAAGRFEDRKPVRLAEPLKAAA
jgi:glycosyltransferase involved in cell wall biosynthesis